MKYNRFEFSQILDDEISVLSLYRWIPDASDALSLTIHLLKKQESIMAWSYFGKRFCDALLHMDYDESDFQNAILVPVPGSGGPAFHTNYFADILAENLNMRKVELLRNDLVQQATGGVDLISKDDFQQKQRSKKARLDRQFHFNVDFTCASKLSGIKNIVLIDDVITTGSTLRACQRLLLKAFPNCKIRSWVMFKRLETSERSLFEIPNSAI